MSRHWESGGDTEGIRAHPASPGPRSTECIFWKLRQLLVVVALC